MDFFDINLSGVPGMAIIALVAFGGDLVRGFTGFGGPAFILAILTLFFTPYSVVAKILVVDFIASVYLFKAVYRQIDWRATASMVIPTLVFMPLGIPGGSDKFLLARVAGPLSFVGQIEARVPINGKD